VSYTGRVRVRPAAALLWCLLLLNGAAIPALLRAVGEPTSNTLAWHTLLFLRFDQRSDSWAPMRQASDYLRQPHDRDVYHALLFDRHVKFQYPLTSLLFTRWFSFWTLKALSWLALVTTAVLIWLILVRAWRDGPFPFRWTDLAVALPVMGLATIFYPLLKAYSLGQIQVWINLLFAGAVLAWQTGSPRLSGVLAGLMTLMKPTYALLIVWGVVRRRFAFAGSAAVVIAAGALVALGVYGWSDNVAYLSALHYIGERGEAFYPNQSVNGLVNRLLGHGNSLRFDRAAFAPFDPLVYACTIVAAVILVGLALWLPRRSRRAGSVVDLSIMIVSLTIASPIAWDHHYGVVGPILAAVLPLAVERAPLGRWTLPALGIVLLLEGQALLITNRLADTWLGIAQSYMFLGALLLLVLLYRLLWAPGRAANVGPPAPVSAPGAAASV
jgi:Glycosyltransferase family 87